MTKTKAVLEKELNELKSLVTECVEAADENDIRDYLCNNGKILFDKLKQKLEIKTCTDMKMYVDLFDFQHTCHVDEIDVRDFTITVKYKGKQIKASIDAVEEM